MNIVLPLFPNFRAKRAGLWALSSDRQVRAGQTITSHHGGGGVVTATTRSYLERFDGLGT